MTTRTLHGQKGVVLIVGLIMLILITLMVTTAFTLGNTNLKSVGNMQFRNESIAAANKAVEQMVGTYFGPTMTSIPGTQTITLDINNDGTADYSALVLPPVCVEEKLVPSTATAPCDPLLPWTCTTSNYSTLWDIETRVTDAVSGASIRIHQGVRKELTQSQCDVLCPASGGAACS
jgi:hypothetical protein